MLRSVLTAGAACVLALVIYRPESSLAADNATAAADSMEEVRVVGQRDLLGQSLQVFGAVDTLAAGDQLSLNRTAGDWISALPGVSLNGQGGLQQAYSVRGFSRWRVRTEVEGVPIITDRRAGNSAAFVPPEFLRGATVRRGPGSSLYGSGALGGVVGLSTIDPEATELSLTAQSNDHLTAMALAGPVGENSALALSVRRADDAEDARGAPLNSGFEQIAGLARSGWGSSDRTLQLLWLPSMGRDIGKSAAGFPAERISDYPYDRNSLLRLDVGSADDWLLRSYHHYQDWETDTQVPGIRRNRTRYRSHTLGALFYAPLQIARGTGRYGLEWVGRRGVSIEDVELSASSPDPRRTQLVDGREDALAAFLEQQWLLGDLSVSGGLRFDRMRQTEGQRERNDGRGTGSLALNWQAAPALQLSAQAGTGFRFPSLSERYFTGVTPRGDTLGNPDLEPESNRGLELGLRYRPGAFDFELSVYRNELDNYIERYFVNSELRSFRNLPEARIEGYEAQLSWQPRAQLLHRLSYQWQRGEQADGSDLADLNPPGWRYFVAWQRGRLGLSSDLRYREPRSSNGPGEQPLPSAWLWGADLAWRFSSHWRGELFLVNALDEQYRAAADEDAAFQPGRTVGLRLQWRGG